MRTSLIFPPLNIPMEYWIEHVKNFGVPYVMLRFRTKYSTREFKALQLVVLAVLGAMD